jgi:hypothetical protein
MSPLLRLAEDMASSPIKNYATPGLTSWRVGGNDHGQVRLFTSERDTREWITPHSHRFDFACLVLAGHVDNITFTRSDTPAGANRFALGVLEPVEGGLGKYILNRDGDRAWFREHTQRYGVGDAYEMASEEIHSIRFSKGARVLFFEGPIVRSTSVVLEPVGEDGVVVPTFDTKPWMFRR